MYLRKASETDIPRIWEIIQYAKEKRRLEGSTQWQDGYPNVDSIKTDIKNLHGYVLVGSDSILLYAAIIFDIEPVYEELKQGWLNNEPYVVVHRVAVAPEGQGLSLGTEFFKRLESLVLDYNYSNIRVDTNYDNVAMLRILEKLNYKYCGEVYFRGAARKAFQKSLALIKG